MKTYEEWLVDKTFQNPDDAVMRSAYANYINETMRSGSTRSAANIKPPLETRVKYLETKLTETILELESLKLKLEN